MTLWRENEIGVVAVLYDSEQYSFVGGLKIIYWFKLLKHIHIMNIVDEDYQLFILLICSLIVLSDY